MVKRPSEWNDMTDEERMNWLRAQRSRKRGGRRVVLKKEDAPRIWGLIKQHENKALVADLIGVSRMTLHRFLEKNPIPSTFALKDDMKVEDYPEIRVWLNRMEGFAGKTTMRGYLSIVRGFYKFMRENHPDHAKPSLWTSDDIKKWIFGDEATGYKGLNSNLWHVSIVPLRSLALKARNEFPNIDTGLLPTKRTHKAKVSLAGREEYYFSPEQVSLLIENAPTKLAKALFAVAYNLAPRTKALTQIKIEDVDFNENRITILDKGSITWDTYGMTEKTKRLIMEYLEERGYPTSGFLFINGNGNGTETTLTRTQVNNMIREAGERAGLTDKNLTAKSFRKSLVENYFNLEDPNPLLLAGTGKERKTCFCVGWTLDVLMKHYAPKMKAQIAKIREGFVF